MLHEDRVTYKILKEWALETYYEGCRDHAVMKGWPHEQIMGYVSYQFENAFERPVENLMWNVILLVLSGGWHKEVEGSIRERIINLLAEHGLEKLLVDVPGDEAEVFRHDLKILRFI